MFMLPLFTLLRRMAERIPFLPPTFPSPEISLFWGTSIAMTPYGTQEVLPTTVGRKYLIGSFLLTSSPSMTLTYPLFFIASAAVVHIPTSSLLPPFSPSPAPGRCFRIWALITYQFFYPSFSLRPIAPTSVLLPSTFRKLTGMTFPSTLTLTVLPQRNTHQLFLGSPLTALFPFLSMHLRWRPSFSHVSLSTCSWGPSKESLFLLYKAFFLTLLTLTLSPLTIGSRSPWLSPSSRSGTLDWWLCSLSFWRRRLRRTCQMLSLWHLRTANSFLFSMPSLFMFFCPSLRHSASPAAFGSTNKSATSLLFSSY